MAALFSSLGINGKLLLAQGINFFILLAVLTFFVYRPLMRVVEERRKKIELGVRSGELAEARLAEIEAERGAKLVEAEKSALGIMAKAQKDAAVRSAELLQEAEKDADAFLESTKMTAEHKKKEELQELARKAEELVRDAIAMAISAAPERVDEELVGRAASTIKEKAVLL